MDWLIQIDPRQHMQPLYVAKPEHGYERGTYDVSRAEVYRTENETRENAHALRSTYPSHRFESVWKPFNGERQ